MGQSITYPTPTRTVPCVCLFLVYVLPGVVVFWDFGSHCGGDGGGGHRLRGVPQEVSSPRPLLFFICSYGIRVLSMAILEVSATRSIYRFSCFSTFVTCIAVSFAVFIVYLVVVSFGASNNVSSDDKI